MIKNVFKLEDITTNNVLIHITHNDSDAVGCALVVSQLVAEDDVLKEDTVIYHSFNSIGRQDDSLNFAIGYCLGKKINIIGVIVSDISIEPETAEFLENVSKENGFKILGVDHHASNTLPERFRWFIVKSGNQKTIRVYTGNYEDDEAYDEFMVPIGACEAMFQLWKNDLINKSFLPNLQTYRNVNSVVADSLEAIVMRISSYDVWNWKNNPYEIETFDMNISDDIKEDIVQKIIMFLGIEDTFTSLWQHITLDNRYGNKSVFPYEHEKIYRALNNKETRDKIMLYPSVKYGNIKDIIDSGIDIDGTLRVPGDGNMLYNVAMFINNGSNPNIISYEMNNLGDNPVDISVILYPGNKNTVSMRSAKVDLSKIAAARGGGGHPGAAGFQVDDETMIKWLTLYYHLPDKFYEKFKEDIDNII